MLAARLHKPNSPLDLDEVPVPEIGRNDVLVRVEASGICHSELHTISGLFPPPRFPVTLGHEGAGIAEKAGDAVKDIQAGDRVALYYMATCGRCHYCLIGREHLCDSVGYLGLDFDGTFAEYVSVPSGSIVKLPKKISFEHGAIAGCAVVTSFHATAIGGVKPGSTVAIYGIGGVGFHGVQQAKLFGASKVIAIDIADEKLRLARHVGADEIVNSADEDPVKKIKELTGGEGVDVAFEYIGLRKTIEQSIHSTRKGGVAVMVGMSGSNIEIRQLDFLSKEAQLRTAWGHTREDLKRLLNLIEAGRVDLSKSVTHRFPLREVNQALDVLRKKTGNPVRIVLSRQ